MFSVAYYIGKYDDSSVAYLDNVPISKVSVIRDLGVHIDSHLKFDTHTHKIVSRAYQRAALILKRFHSKDFHAMVRAFTVYV